MVFNGTFSLAMVLIRDALLDAGILLRLRAGSPAFWDADPAVPTADPEVVSLVDAAFVDDERFMLTARLPEELDAAVDVVLHAVCDIYDRLNLTINWKAGKSECFLTYRGANHLRQQAAMSYGPLASKVFGSVVMDASLKIWLMHSLVLSRLLFNVHVVVPTRRYLQVLNGMYMRVLRRVGDAPRFGHSETDLEIRTRLKQPSLDCLVMRARLRYLGRLVRSSPPALLALLAARPGGARLPWVTLLVSDLGKLRELVALCSTLPPPEGTASAWVTFISDSPARWANAVSMLFFTDSCCDRGGAAPVGGGTRPFACHQCDARFATAKARDQHLRIRHHVRCLQRSYAGADATCPVCHAVFALRLRLLPHLCDARRPACWEAIRACPARYPPLPQKQVAELDDLDKVQRREAQRQGLSHAPAQGPARRADGSDRWARPCLDPWSALFQHNLIRLALHWDNE
ncbi:unnamed protein product [Prorocentrum cordatum]|uniref:C2H2-type domain-containing protein n=1 Tax=Prorocentrum cordatum TaxID=2364126 RepID=A0ABN9USE9_9DINO|nr:unnamed protein product [Polarella glacialis]